MPVEELICPECFRMTTVEKYKNTHRIRCRFCNKTIPISEDVYKDLRPKTDRAMYMHMRPPGKANKSGYKGVSYDQMQEKWYASITINGTNKRLGFYNTAEEAALVYNKAALKYYGSHAYQNVIPKKEKS